MLKRLQERWKVNGISLLLIIATFALGGSLCGYAGRKLLLFSGLERGVLWVFCYIVLITLLWPFCVLLVSIPLGQFPFFRRYIARVIGRFGGRKRGEAPIRIAIFASGTGTNAHNLINYFSNSTTIKVQLVVCNNPAAGVRQVAKDHGIELLMIDKDSLADPSGCLAALQQRNIGFLILAGFLWKVPSILINAFPGKIINIHPALLPKYGGKGMYGKHVHEAVIAHKEKQSGITIHIADEIYDHGKVLFQATCEITGTDTADTVAQKVHQLEQLHFPKVVAAYLEKQNHS